VKRNKFIEGRLPRSREEALADPVRVIACDWETTKHNLKMGYLEPYRWILNRPMSLQFDIGIDPKSPITSGELTCTAE
jgi:hypothetical protein